MEENKSDEKVAEQKSETVEEKKDTKKFKMPWANWSKRKKRWSMAGCIVVFIFLLLLFLPGLIVSHIVPPVASELLKVKVEIGPCFINIFDGSVRVRNVKIHNPEGYDAPYAFELGHFYVDVKMLTLASDKIEIADIIIDDMHATLEMKLTTNNLQDISNNLPKPAEDKAEKEPEKEDEPAEEEPEKETPKMVIRHFKISNSDFTMLKIPWPIPSLELTDVGDGRPISDFVVVVYDAVMDAVIQASKAVSDGVVSVGKDIGDAAKDAGDAVVEGTKDAIKNIFGK